MRKKTDAGKSIFYIIVVLLFAAESVLLIYTSLTTYGPGSERGNPPYFDKVVHFAAYFVYAVLAERTFALGKGKTGIAFSIVIGGVMGIITEYIQLFVPERSAAITDFAANMSGTLIGGLFAVRYVSGIKNASSFKSQPSSYF